MDDADKKRWMTQAWEYWYAEAEIAADPVDGEPLPREKIPGLQDQADGSSVSRRHGLLKRAKARQERHRARLNPECQPAYRRFRGYEL